MNARTVSLPDLVTEKRRNTALSLSEGFAGARHEGALLATSQSWCPRPGAGAPILGEKDPGVELQKVLPSYYRTRQLALATEKGGHRIPRKLQYDLRAVEKALAREIRAVHPLFFQRFDEAQLDRLLRAMPFLRCSAGRWLFGADTLGAQWPPAAGDRAFLLLQGRITLYPDPAGAGEKTEINRGDVFGENRFSLGDESMRNYIAGAAHCEEPCIVAVLQTAALEAAYADRAFGNVRIAQTWRKVPSMARICKADEDLAATAQMDGTNGDKDDQEHGAVTGALRDISKVATACHFNAGHELLSNESWEESILVVSKGVLEVRGDITLTEKLDALPPKKVRIRVHIIKATNLAGDSIFDKLDPYVVCKLGDFKKFQTPVLWNVGSSPKIDFTGVLTFASESEELSFTVMDRDQYSADDLCGTGSVSCKTLPDGWTGAVQLTRPKKGIFKSEDSLDEPAGKLFIKIKYDYEKVSALTRTPKSKSWRDQELFSLSEQDCWGHEQIMLQDLFMRTLEQAASQTTYMLQLSNIRLIGGAKRGGSSGVSVWKCLKPRFIDFVKHTGREKPFMQACRVSTLSKQTAIKNIIKRLIKKWEIEMETMELKKSISNAHQPKMEEVVDPNMFRIAYRGYKAHVSVRNALNLSGGGFFDKLDPYAILRFRGSKQRPMRTSVLQDAGADPVWNDEADLVYNGETALEIQVWDYDKYSADDLIGTGVLQVENFCGGFEGMIPLSLPNGKKSKSMKQMTITIGIQWPRLEQNVGNSLTLTDASRSLRTTA